jgi:hypothetical protein
MTQLRKRMIEDLRPVTAVSAMLRSPPSPTPLPSEHCRYGPNVPSSAICKYWAASRERLGRTGQF